MEQDCEPPTQSQKLRAIRVYREITVAIVAKPLPKPRSVAIDYVQGF